MTTKLISIIIPVYNAEDYIERCVKSIQAQTYKNLEIILINDGSKDKSFDICAKLKASDDRIIFLNQGNQGAMAARCAGINNSTGDYITFVDSDDYIEPNMYELMLAALEENMADICACSANRVVDGNKISMSVGNHIYDEPLKPYMTFDMMFCYWNKLYKSELIKNHDFIDLKIGEDALNNLQIMERVSKVVTIDDYLYNYIQNDTSVSKGKLKSSDLDYIPLVEEECSKLVAKNPDLKNYAQAMIQYCWLLPLDIAFSTHPTTDEEKELYKRTRKQGKKMFYQAISNKELKVAYKFAYVAIKLNMYNFAFKLYGKISGN